MNTLSTSLFVGVLAMSSVAVPFATANAHEHHRAARAVFPVQAPGAEIAAATARAQNEPGVTNELAPDAKQTATGGPSGGVPGFSGF